MPLSFFFGRGVGGAGRSGKLALFPAIGEGISEPKASPVRARLYRTQLIASQLSKSQINGEIQQQFKINKRQANSIIAYIEGQVRSQRSALVIT